jgi:hypothetical protein
MVSEEEARVPVPAAVGLALDNSHISVAQERVNAIPLPMTQAKGFDDPNPFERQAQACHTLVIIMIL